MVLALVLPVELVIDVTSSHCNWMCPISQLDYLLQNVLIMDPGKFWVLVEVSCNDFNGHFHERFDVLRWERLFILLARLRNLQCYLIVTEGPSFLLLLLLLGTLLSLGVLGFLRCGGCKVSFLHFINPL